MSNFQGDVDISRVPGWMKNWLTWHGNRKDQLGASMAEILTRGVIFDVVLFSVNVDAV